MPTKTFRMEMSVAKKEDLFTATGKKIDRYDWKVVGASNDSFSSTLVPREMCRRTSRSLMITPMLKTTPNMKKTILTKKKLGR